MKKKLILCILICALLILLALSLLVRPKTPEEQFTTYVQNHFQETLANDALSLHFTLLDPSAYSMESASQGLPLYTEASYLSAGAEIQEQLDNLSQIDCSQLPPKLQEEYAALNAYLTYQEQLCEYPYYNNPLSSESGMQTALPVLLSEYRLLDQEDIYDYFTILESIPDYLNGLYTYLCHRIESGLPSTNVDLEQAALQCTRIFTKDDLINNTHFLIETFMERLDVLLADSIITQSEYSLFLSTNKELLLHVCLPAYQDLSENLLTLEGSPEPQWSLATYPNGSSYYVLELAHATASNRTIDELKLLLTQSFQENYTAYLSTVDTIQEILSSSNQEVMLSLPHTDSDSILDDICSKMRADFPPFPSNESIRHKIKTVAHNLEPYVAPAYYLTPPIDDVSHNTIYVNYESPLDPLTLYTTLAHEGYPGHLYQSVYHYLDSTSQTELLLTPLLSYLGYVEGWAYYVENIAYEYAKLSLPQDENYQLASLYIDSIRLNRNLQLCFFSLLDIAIHYDGITFEEAKVLIEQFGIKDTSQIQELYDYILLNPTTYPTYYIGYSEVLATKELAKHTWGTSYSDMEFHTFYLSTGPCNFTTLQSKIASY